MSDAIHDWAKEAMYFSVRAEAMSIHEDKFEDGKKIEMLAGGEFAVVYHDQSFSVAAMGGEWDDEEDFLTVRMGTTAIHMQIPYTLVEQDSVQPSAMDPNMLLWSVGDKVLAVIDEMGDEHIALHFRTFDEASKRLMLYVIGYVTEKTGPTIVIDA